MSVHLEGSLLKWTNYYLGWQCRWFVLDNGALSYYLSANEVTQGSRGSVKVASCNITAHYKDPKRIDVIITGGRYMYLKADSQTERQKWLVALGSAKQEEAGASPVHDSAVKSKMILLHSNCQLLVSQLAAIKAAIANKDALNESTLEELSSKVSMSCDEFLNVLAECMDLNFEDSVWPSHLKPLSAVSVGSPHSICSPPSHMDKTSQLVNNGFFTRDEPYLSSTPPIQTTPTGPHPSHPLPVPFHLKQPPTHCLKNPSPPPPRASVAIDTVTTTTTRNLVSQSQKPHSRSNSELFLTPTGSPSQTPPPSPKTYVVTDSAYIETFFSKLPHKFTDIQLLHNNGIPTVRFLQSCRAAVPFFDILSPTAFSPVKQDINGNIDKLNSKYNANPDGCNTLQAMVLKELEDNTQNARNSATDALVWLKRAMEFIQVFLMEAANGEERLEIAAGKAYNASLKQHHSWIVKGIFNLAVRAVPYHNDFLKLLGSDGTAPGNNAVIKDMKQFSVALNGLIVILNQFYQSQKLDV